LRNTTQHWLPIRVSTKAIQHHLYCVGLSDQSPKPTTGKAISLFQLE